MRLTVLGCRAGMPADGQPSSGYLVTSGTTKILLDCGPGIATALSGVMRPGELSAVVISHLHLDHCYDLLPIGKTLLTDHFTRGSNGSVMDALGQGAANDLRPVPLLVPAGAGATFARLAQLFPVTTAPALDRAFELAYDVREYQPGDTVTVGDCTISLHLLRHASPNCGVRVTGPTGTVAYTGDTGTTHALADLARDADLLLAEATLTETDRGDHGHLSAADAAMAAAEGAAKQLVLTHLTSNSPQWIESQRDMASELFEGVVLTAAPGREFDVVAAAGVRR